MRNILGLERRPLEVERVVDATETCYLRLADRLHAHLHYVLEEFALATVAHTLALTNTRP